MALRAFSLTSPVGDLAGDVALTAAPRPAIRGTLASNRLDLDAVRALLPTHAAAAPVAAPTAPPQQSAAPAGPVFSDAPLPWDRLRAADADLQFSIGALRVGGADYRAAAGHLVLTGGALSLNPAAVVAPEGRVDFSASLDASQPAPPVALALRAAAFAIDPLLVAFGLPGGSEGAAEIDVALHAAGASPHALAASLDGHAGLALVDGELANAALTAVLGDAMRSAGAALDPGGRSHVRCLALRADAASGQVTLTALKLDTARLSLDGSGTINLADETMALHLRPLLRLGLAGVSSPLRVSGALRRPVVAMDPAGPGAGRVGVVIGGLAGPPDSCAPELIAARDGRAGRLPTAETQPARPGKPADLLRSLLR